MPQQKKLQEELSDLSAMEDALDELIKDCAQQLFELTDDKENERYPLTLYLLKKFLLPKQVTLSSRISLGISLVHLRYKIRPLDAKESKGLVV